MPLRPALATIHPRRPEPRQLRRVLCPHCGRAFEVSTRAMSVRCPSCTRPLEFKDLTLRQRLDGDVSTMGHVELSDPSEMIGRLVCGRFTNTGRFEGQAVVYGAIELTGNSLTVGELTGKSLCVHHGATARAKANILPKPTLGQGEGKPRTRQTRRLIPRIAAVSPKGLRPLA
jgi:cytoskeletal protein CcmA (bactofilin family)